MVHGEYMGSPRSHPSIEAFELILRSAGKDHRDRHLQGQAEEVLCEDSGAVAQVLIPGAEQRFRSSFTGRLHSCLGGPQPERGLESERVNKC